MCLSIPAKIITVEGENAVADIGGNHLRIGIQLLESVRPGDYVLVHSGFALQLISEEDAKVQIDIIRAMKGESNDEVH